MLRRLSPVLAVLVAAALLSAVASAAAQPFAQSARGCAVGAGKGYGYSYLTSLTVRGTSCATGRTVVAHHGHVQGWSCSKKRLATSPVQYDDRETCRSGPRQVAWTFTQNT